MKPNSSQGTRRLLAASAAAAVGLLAAAPAARAHRVGLVVVAPPDAPAGDAVDGFRLAVDQSPDVSHPPGPGAGDHLGGIDVEVTVVERGERPADAGRRVARLVSSGARLVVVLPPATVSREIVPRIRVDGVLIVAAGTRAALPKKPALPVVLLGDRPLDRDDRGRLARFEQAFARRYARTPSRAARSGYNAARLLDRVLARLGEGPFTGQALSTAVARAAGALVTARATVVPAVADGDDADPPADRSADRSPVAVALTAVGLAVTLVAASLALRLARRRRRSTTRRF